MSIVGHDAPGAALLTVAFLLALLAGASLWLLGKPLIGGLVVVPVLVLDVGLAEELPPTPGDWVAIAGFASAGTLLALPSLAYARWLVGALRSFREGGGHAQAHEHRP